MEGQVLKIIKKIIQPRQKRCPACHRTLYNAINEQIVSEQRCPLEHCAFKSEINQAILESKTPEVLIWEIDKTEIFKNNSAILSWEVLYAKKVSISTLGDVPLKSTQIISPLRDTTYTLIIQDWKNNIFETEQTITVKVIPLPIISFKSDKKQVEIGDSVKLSWNIVNAINAHLLYEGKKEEVPPEDTKALTINENTVFKVIVTALDKVTLFEEELSVEVFEKPTILFFNVAPEVVLDCVPVDLSWSVENAKKIVIDNGVGEVSMIGSKKTLLQKNQTMFKLTAYGELSNAEQEVFVKVFPTPIIESLKVPMPDFESRFKLHSMPLTPPDINVSINLPEFSFSFNLGKPEYITPDIPLNKIKPKYDSKSSIFNFSTLYERIRRKTKT